MEIDSDRIRRWLERLSDDLRGVENENVGENSRWKEAEVVVDGRSHE